MISEYCFLFAALTAAVGTISNIYTQHTKGGHPVLIVLACAAYFSFFMWVYR